MQHNLYIHIPFCAQLCSYCNFAKTLSVKKEEHQKYFSALKKEIQASDQIKKGDTIKTLYFGGGTPSLPDPGLYKELFQFLQERFQFASDIEITLECHPTTVTETKAQAWEDIGITRISLGVQTFQKKYDRFLERKLTGVQEALSILQERSYMLSLDCIFGFPEQTKEELLADLQAIKDSGIQHVSYYALDYKPNAKIEHMREQGLPFEQYQEYYALIIDQLQLQGFDHYEVYNFAKNGEYSQHNLNFWRGEDYIGFGASAVGLMGRSLRENAASLNSYYQGKCDVYQLDDEEWKEQIIKRKLRLTEGISLTELEDILGNDYASALKRMKTAPSWFCLTEKNLQLTQEAAMMFSDAIDIIIASK